MDVRQLLALSRRHGGGGGGFTHFSYFVSVRPFTRKGVPPPKYSLGIIDDSFLSIM